MKKKNSRINIKRVLKKEPDQITHAWVRAEIEKAIKSSGIEVIAKNLNTISYNLSLIKTILLDMRVAVSLANSSSEATRQKLETYYDQCDAILLRLSYFDSGNSLGLCSLFQPERSQRASNSLSNAGDGSGISAEQIIRHMTEAIDRQMESNLEGGSRQSSPPRGIAQIEEDSRNPFLDDEEIIESISDDDPLVRRSTIRRRGNLGR